MFSASKTKQVVSGGITNSLRFRRSASAFLSKTLAANGSRTTATVSFWVKRSTFGVDNRLMAFDSSGSGTIFWLFFNSSNQLQIYISGAGTGLTTTQVFQDPSAWYHIVVAIDTTQSTSSDRIKLYINNSQVTSFTGTQTYYSLNATVQFNYTGYTTYFGYTSSTGLDGYLAEVNWIDGQALTPSSFGATDATTGAWKPKTYSGTYGTNGFYLTFTNATSTTTLGYDSSGNSNNWATNNISLTAGATYDSMNDVPALTSATASNYPLLNPLRTYSNITLTNCNLTALFTDASVGRTSFSTFGVTSGKFYWEATITTASTYYPGVGVNTDLSANPSLQSGDTAAGYMYLPSGQKYTNLAVATYGSSFTNNDVIGIALNMDAGTITFYKNNTSQGQAFSGITGTAVPCFIGQLNALTSINFGQKTFTYTPPTGYVALNSYNLPTPTIAQSNKYMDATTYTGTGASASITNAGSFKPDLVWIKSRSAATDHKLTDSVRGVTKALISDTTGAETTDTTGLTSFNSNGFTVGADTNYNNTSATYVGWQWLGGGTAVSNTSGSITSSVSANTTSGFSVVTYTGTGVAGTIGHGLGVAPSMIIIKARSTTGDWPIYHSSVGNGSYTLLDTTAASTTSSTIWNATSPTSSVFSVGINTVSNTITTTYVAYCFAPITGFSAFGSYTGNGSTSGPFVYIGFQPKYLLIKRTDSTSDWYIWDSVRNTFNTVTNTLLADTSGAETSASSVNILSNGFQCISATVVNVSSGTYIYAAFASISFRNSNAF